jgi:UDPglucose 6-dehydrogenase
VLNDLQRICYSGLCVIKSTVLPSIVRRIINDYKSLNIVTNPEFLTEKNALHDFINAKTVIIGGDEENRNVLYQFFKRLWPNAKFSLLKADEAMMIKYMLNNYLTVKVSFINEYYDLVNKSGMNWNFIISTFSADDRIGKTHLNCPGPDGDRGFGGKCFPKDLNAMIYEMEQLNVQHDVLKAAWSDNEHFRKNKDWLNIKWATVKKDNNT